MKIYDEENGTYDEDEEDFAGYTINDDHSIFGQYTEQEETETVATPIPENENTVILAEPKVAGLPDGAELKLQFTDDGLCHVIHKGAKVGSLKEAYVRKLKAERGGGKGRVYYKKDVPPMVRIVFGEGEDIPREW